MIPISGEICNSQLTSSLSKHLDIQIIESQKALKLLESISVTGGC